MGIIEQRGVKNLWAKTSENQCPLECCVPWSSSLLLLLLLKLTREKKLDTEIRQLATVNKSTHVFYCAVAGHLLSLPGCCLKNTIKYVHQFRLPPLSLEIIWNENIRKLKTENCWGKWGLLFFFSVMVNGKDKRKCYISFLTNTQGSAILTVEAKLPASCLERLSKPARPTLQRLPLSFFISIKLRGLNFMQTDAFEFRGRWRMRIRNVTRHIQISLPCYGNHQITD